MDYKRLTSRHYFVCALICMAAATAWGDYNRVNAPNSADRMGVHIYRLANGLTVYLTENHETPRFYAEIAVRAGSKHDPPETTGLAHYLEHLLFKGNQKMGTLEFEKEKPHLDRITELYEEHFKEDDPEKRKALYAEIDRVSQLAAAYAIPNEIDKLYNAMGGTGVNAHTWHEETVYKVSLPSNRLRQWAAIESDRFDHPVFRLFYTELETVYEEKNRAMDNKGRVINEAVNRLLNKKHPYGQQPTLGSVEHLKRPSLVNIYDFYNTHYVPNNMAIFISGDIDIEEAIRVIDETFSSWPSAEVPDFDPPKEAPLKGVERVTVEYRAEEYALLAFRTAPRGHEDTEVLALLDMVLDNSVAGLINLNLNQQQRVRQAGSFPSTLIDYGAQYLFGIPKKDQTLEEVEKLLLEQVKLIRNGDFEDWILSAIVTDFKKSAKALLESDRARVAMMRDSFIAHADWDYTVGRIARMEKVTKDDLVRVANKYFGGGYVAGYRVDEQQDILSIEKPAINPVEIDPKRESQFAKGILAMPYEEIEPVFVDPEKDYSIVRQSEGIKLYYAPNPLNDLFSFSIVVEVGTREDNKVAIATQFLDKSGTQRLGPEALKKEWYKLGTDFGIGTGDNETTISISGLDENFEASLALLMEVITTPSADAQTLEELKKIILVKRADAKKDPGTLSGALSQFNRYGEDSSYLRMLPDDAVNALTAQELHGSIQGLLNFKHTNTYTGSLPLDKVQAILAKHYAVQDELRDPPPYRFRTTRTPGATEIYLFDKKMAQAQIRLEFADGVFDEQRNAAVELYNSYFAGGMSGIVFQELREARALAYSAGAHYLTGSRKGDENLMIGGLGCQADKAAEAVAAFVDLLDNLPESPERFEDALNSVINRYRTSKIGFRGVLGAVRSWERLGLPVDPREERFKRMLSADIGLMLEFHKGRIRGSAKLISIVGDKSKVPVEKLKEMGALKEIGLDDIFVN